MAILDFISAKFVIGYPCVRHYILFYINGPAILHFFFELRKYKYTQNYKYSKWPLNGHFEFVCFQKVISSLTDIAEHICQIKRKSDGNFFLKHANEFFFVIGLSN